MKNSKYVDDLHSSVHCLNWLHGDPIPAIWPLYNKRDREGKNTNFDMLRVLSECLILMGSAMFDATFNPVTRVGLP